MTSTRYGISVYLVNSSSNFINLISDLSTDTDIEYFDLNYIMESHLSEPPTNDSYNTVNEALMTDPHFLEPYEKINLFNAWNISKGSQEVIIANLDNGIFLNHEDLNAGPDQYTNIWYNSNEIPYNGLDDDNNGYADDYYGWNFGSSALGNNDLSHADPVGFPHGTIMAGIIAAKTNNAIGSFGVAGGWNSPGVRVMNVKVYNDMDSPEAAFLPKAIEYACENGARVVNMTFGVAENMPSIQSMIEMYYNENNVIFCASAGNNIGFLSSGPVSFPARIPCVISVSGSISHDSPEQIWSTHGITTCGYGIPPKNSSNAGPEVNFAAPVNPSIQLRVTTDPYNNLISDYRFLLTDESCMAGTSCSASILAGVVGLMLSVDPCLTVEEIFDILKNTADKVGGYDYEWDSDNIGHSQEFGYGRINAAAAVAACLPETVSPVISLLSWNTQKRIANDIVIENGGELKINAGALIRMNPYSKVVVKPGGKLIIDGGKITTTCNNMWLGIQIWGNASLPQLPITNQGYIQVINEGTIENALCGIKVYRPDDRSFDNKPGGIAICNGAIFHNNQMSLDVRYLPGVDNLTNISYSRFLLDDKYLSWKKQGSYGERVYPNFYQHIYMRSVAGINLYSNEFSNTQGYLGFPYKGIGIFSSNSYFSVLPTCTQSPCEDNPVETNTFSGFEYGIYATNDAANEKFRVENAKFNNTYIGIYTENVPYAKIVKNKFNIPAISTNAWAGGRIATGLYMDVSTGYHVEANDFDGGSIVYGRSNIGTYIKNSGPSTNYIYRNTFRELGYGSIAEGYNYNQDSTLTGTGLCYKCNIFIDNGTDFAVVATEKELPNGIKTYQGGYGDDAAPAGNIFSQQTNTMHINNREGDVIMRYLHHGKSLTVPLSWLIPSNIIRVFPSGAAGTYFQESVSCKSWLDNEHNEEKLLSDYSQSLEAENQVKESIFVLQDGGDTEGVIFEITTSSPQNAYTLTEDLLTISPYLSDSTLNIIAENEFVFDNSLVRDILVSNPHAGKSFKVLNKLENRLNPMSDEMYQEIIDASENIGPYEQMLESFENYNSIRYKNFDELVDLYISDNENETGTQKLINLVNQDNSLYADLVLIRHFVIKNMFSEANIRSANLNTRFLGIENISLLQSQILDFITIYQLTNDTTGVDSVNLATLNSIAINGEYPVCTWASKLLANLSGIHSVESYILPSPGELQNSRVRTINSKNNSTAALTVYPNPAVNYFIATYKTPNETDNNRIIVRSLDGKPLLESNLVGCNNSKTIYLYGISAGTYIIELLSNKISICTTKIQVIR